MRKPQIVHLNYQPGQLYSGDLKLFRKRKVKRKGKVVSLPKLAFLSK